MGAGRGSGIPMSRRVGLSSGSLDDCPARHCWVAGAADDRGVKRAGLLVEWRTASAGWEGRVVYVARLRAGGWAVVEEWLPESLLSHASAGDSR